jgi:hypothetical protein
MPFKKVKVKKMVEEKRVDPEFDEAYRDVENEYKLNQKEVEDSESNRLSQKDSTEKHKKVVKKTIP